MYSNKSVCKKCGAEYQGQFAFCPRCGCELSKAKKPLTRTRSSDQFKGLTSRVKIFKDKAVKIRDGASSVVSQERASDAVRRMIDLLIQVARDVRDEIPADMVKAIDLEAEISFIAFSIGVSIDLEQIRGQNSS